MAFQSTATSTSKTPDQAIDLILHTPGGFFDRYATAITDSVLEKTPAEVVFLHGRLPRESVKTILLPFGENVHTHLALEIAPALVDHFSARLKVVLVVPPSLDPTELERRRSAVDNYIREKLPSAHVRVVENEDVVQAIVRESEAADLLLMGGRTGSLWEMLATSSMTEDITQRARCPVVWAEEYEESKSLLARLLSPAQEDRKETIHAA